MPVVSSPMTKRSAVGTYRRLVIAVDPGTTNSGVAWAQTARADLLIPIIQWPTKANGSLDGATSEKVPNERMPDGRWGFMIKEHEHRYQWFKLDLLTSNTNHNSSLVKKYPAKNALPPSYDKDGATLFTENLKSLVEHALKVIAKQIGQLAMDSTPKEYVITVPAMCTEAEQEKIRMCAEEAGLKGVTKLYVISEPEAAMLYSLDSLDPNTLQIDDTYVLVDAGGGTVDCISYSITAVRPTVHVKEAAPGSGDLCGSTFLNRIFQNWLEGKFKTCAGWTDETLTDAMQRFETTIKREFSGDLDDEFMVPLPGLLDNAIKGVKRSKYRLTADELRPMFQEVTAEVIKLVKGQVESTENEVKGIFLVGGFGGSPFLLNALQKEFGHIEVCQPGNGWTAVVRGALIKGMSEVIPSLTRIKIDSRVARKHYGTSYNVAYNPLVHRSTRKIWDDYEGEYKVTVMHWFILRGHEFKEGESEREPFVFHRLCSDGSIRADETQIYACATIGNGDAPQYPDDPMIKPLVKLVSRFDARVRNALPKTKGKDGEDYYEFEYDIRLKFSSGRVEYSLWRNDERYGSVTADYD